jgi:hypothetical protein
MARARNIKPGFFTNPELVELSFETRLLFAGLWTVADRKGRLEDRPKKIKMEVFPADAVDIDMMLGELCKAGFVIRYEVQGTKYIQVSNWMKHQSPHHTERASVIPPPPGLVDEQEMQCVNGEGTDSTQERDGGNPPDSLIHRFTDSPIPDSASEEPSVGAAADKPAANTRGSRLAKDWFLPKPWGDWALNEFKHWTAEIVRVEAEKFKDHWLSESGAKARKVDWLATWRKWCRSDLAQKAHQPKRQGVSQAIPNKYAGASAAIWEDEATNA